MIEFLIEFIFSNLFKSCIYKKIPLPIRVLILIPILLIYCVIVWASINIAIETNSISKRILFIIVSLGVILSLIPFIKKVFTVK